MSRENLKLISVRIDPDTLEAIDKFCRDRRYWKRNGVINSILTAAVQCLPPNDLYDMARYSDYFKEDVEAKFTIKKNSI